jgi:hypothetical protein
MPPRTRSHQRRLIGEACRGLLDPVGDFDDLDAEAAGLLGEQGLGLVEVYRRLGHFDFPGSGRQMPDRCLPMKTVPDSLVRLSENLCDMW